MIGLQIHQGEPFPCICRPSQFISHGPVFVRRSGAGHGTAPRMTCRQESVSLFFCYALFVDLYMWSS